MTLVQNIFRQISRIHQSTALWSLQGMVGVCLFGTDYNIEPKQTQLKSGYTMS